MEINGWMGSFYKLSVLITRFTFTNLIWLFLNFPIVYIMLSLMVHDMTHMLLQLLPFTILLPLLFFPATCAMFAVVRRWIVGEGDTRVFQSFLKYYKENYKQSVKGGFIFGFLWISLCLNYFVFFYQQSMIFTYLFIGLAAFLFTWNSYFFSMLVHFEMKLFTSLKSSLFVTIGNPISSAGVAIISGILTVLSLKFTFIIAFFLGSLSVYCSFFYFYKVIQKTMRKINSINMG